MDIEKYKKMRYVGIYRTSTSLQSEKSIPDQQQVVSNFASQLGMEHAGKDVIQSGVSSSKRRKREDIDDLIERKATANDFDAILIHDFSRLTRRGVHDAFEIERKLNRNGIHVISATEPMPDGPYENMIKAAIHSQHHLYARELAQRVTRGQMSSFKLGQHVGSASTPYGIDRLYSSLSGQPRHIIRILADGSKVKLDPTTGAILTTYEKSDNGASVFYRRQPDEKVSFVKGNPVYLDRVRRMFSLVLVDGLGYRAVARLLYNEGIPTPRGGKWSESGVKAIVTNPVYTGRLIRNRVTRAEYYSASAHGPIQVPDDPLTRDSEKPITYRSPSDWVFVPAPATADILSPELMELAIPFQDSVLRRTSEIQHGPRRDKHSDSTFFLKDVFRLKQTGSLMKGFSTANKRDGKVYRYYQPKINKNLNGDPVYFRKRMSADVVEAFAISILQRIFLSIPDIRSSVRQHVVKEQSLRHEQKTSIGDLESQRRNLVKKIGCFADLAGDFDDEVMKKVADMKGRLRTLDAKLKAARSEVLIGDVDEITNSVMRNLMSMDKAMRGATPMTLRRIIVALVDRMECDPITREVWLTLRLPNVKPGKLGAVDEPVFCLDSNTFQNTAPETNNLLLAEVHLSFVSEVVFRKRLTSFKNFRYAITGGVLQCDGEHELTAVEPLPTPPTVMMAAPVDSGAWWGNEWGLTAPWTFGASVAA